MRNFFLFLSLFVILSTACLSGLENRFTPLNLVNGSIEKVEEGDTVRINYILSTLDEQVFDTSYEEVASNWGLNLSRPIEPMLLKIGEDRYIPGLEEEILGMKALEQKEFVVTPEKGFGQRNESLIKTFFKTTVFPKTDVLSIESFRQIFQAEPKFEEKYSLTYWNATVTQISNDDITIFNDAKNHTVSSDGGSVHITVNETSIIVTRDPVLNSTIMTIEGTGRVLSIDEDSYTVDMNHPLAGRSILVFIRLEEIIKPGLQVDGNVTLGEMEFLTSLEEAKSISRDTKKPLFIYAHAPWCSWCRKFEADVLRDKDVLKILKEGYVNFGLDVDVQKGIAQDFMILGTPTMIFLDSNGAEVMRIRGYHDRESFKEVLDKVSKGHGI